MFGILLDGVLAQRARVNGMAENEMRTIYLQRWIKGIFITCLALQVFFIIADYIFNYKDIFDEKNVRNIWNIAREMSIPTWFSSLQVQLLGFTAFLIAAVQVRSLSRLKIYGWVLIGFFLSGLGLMILQSFTRGFREFLYIWHQRIMSGFGAFLVFC